MAKIPMGNFGQALPQVERVQLPQSNLNEIAGAIGNVSNVATQQQRHLNHEQDQQDVTNKILELREYEQQDVKARADMDNVLSTDFSDYVATLKNDVGNGNKTAAQANLDLTAYSDERYKSLEENVPFAARKDAKKYWDDSVLRQRGAFVPLQLKASEQQGYATAEQMMGIYTRTNVDRTEGENKLRENLIKLNLPQAFVSEQMHKFNVQRDLNEVEGLINNAFAGSDISSLQSTKAELKNYKYLNGDQMVNLEKMIDSRIHTLNERQQVLEHKRVTEAGKVLTEFKNNVMTGLPMDLGYMSNVSTAVKGTEHEAEFEFYKANSNDIQQFGRLSTSEQLNKINSIKTKLKNTPQTDAKKLNDILGVYESGYQEKLKLAKENPSQLIQEKNIKLPELSAIGLQTDISKTVKDITDIGTTMMAMQAKDANVVLKPIPPDKLPEMKQAFEKMSVDQKLDFIGGLVQQGKNIKGGEKIWGATLGQLGQAQPIYLMAGIAKHYGYRSEQGVDLATALVAGSQLLKNDQLKLPENDLRTQFNDTVGNTLIGESSNKAYEAYKATYAYLLNQRGIKPGDPKKATDEEKNVMKEALSIGVGGFYSQPGNFKNNIGGDIKDWKVPKPYGLNDNIFEAALEGGYSNIAAGLGMRVDDLKQYQLKQSGTLPDGGYIYTLHDARGLPLTRKLNGKDVAVPLAVPRNTRRAK